MVQDEGQMARTVVGGNEFQIVSENAGRGAQWIISSQSSSDVLTHP